MPIAVAAVAAAAAAFVCDEGIPAYDRTLRWPVDATCDADAFVAVVGDDGYFSRDILAVIAADGRKYMQKWEEKKVCVQLRFICTQNINK